MSNNNIIDTSLAYGIKTVRVESDTKQITDFNRWSITGVIGTADGADADKYPLNTPVLLYGEAAEVEALGSAGMLSVYAKHAFKAKKKPTLFVRVEKGADDAATAVNIVGDAAAGTGLHAMINAQSVTGFSPRTIIAPKLSGDMQVVQALSEAADRLGAHAYVDINENNDSAAITAAGNDAMNHKRINPVWPPVIIDSEEVPKSIIDSLLDDEIQFHESTSNRPINIDGLAFPVDFFEGDSTCTANKLLQVGITTAIHSGSQYVSHGMRNSYQPSGDDDKQDKYRHAVRIDDALQFLQTQAVKPLQARKLNRANVDNALINVENVINGMVSRDELPGGRVWLDDEYNSAASWADNQIVFSTDYAIHGYGETIYVTSQRNTVYLSNYVNQILGASDE